MRMILAAISLALLLALTAIPCHAGDSQNPPSFPQQTPAMTGHFGIAGAIEGLRLGGGDAPTSLVLEGALRLPDAIGPISLNVAARHFLKDAYYWKNKSEFVAAFDVPLGHDTLFFAEWTRRYRADESWTMAGVRVRFSASGSR